VAKSNGARGKTRKFRRGEGGGGGGGGGGGEGFGGVTSGRVEIWKSKKSLGRGG